MFVSLLNVVAALVLVRFINARYFKHWSNEYCWVERPAIASCRTQWKTSATRQEYVGSKYLVPVDASGLNICYATTLLSALAVHPSNLHLSVSVYLAKELLAANAWRDRVRAVGRLRTL